jgi:starch-binding outer membrane protein, SusD/RagB family
MKKYTNIIFSSILALLLSGCSEKILDKTPQDAYSDATVWTDVNLASTYLNGCYSNVGFGLRPVALGSVTDEVLNGRGPNATPYHLGSISADNLSGTYGSIWYDHISWSIFPQVQQINLFLANIDLVSEAYPESEKAGVKAKTDILKGEALFLRAFAYTNLCRCYGGLPIMDKANQLGDDFSLLVRATFEETVNFIVKDCDDAAGLLLEKSEMEMGRATKEAALALKSRILLFAASDLTADADVINDLVGYTSPDRTALWTAAKNAAYNLIQMGTCELTDLGAPDQKAVAKNYYEIFKAYDLANKEVIWGKMFLPTLGTTHAINETWGPNGNDNYGRCGPFQRMVDSYEMSDGSKFFDHFDIVDDKYIFKNATFHHESPYYDREPRFYASVLYDSAVWQPRFQNFAERDPLGIYERRTHITMQGGVETGRVYGIDTRNGPVSNWNGTYGGYLTKKWMDNLSIGRDEMNQNIYIWIRYAEVILNYAEACLELGEIETATDYINIIRNRAGLPDFTGDITEALRYERKIELYMEESRWYDIRRWKILKEALGIINYGIDITEVNDLDAGTITTTWKRIEAQARNAEVFNDKIYWIPIETEERNRAPQLEQNPGY